MFKKIEKISVVLLLSLSSLCMSMEAPSSTTTPSSQDPYKGTMLDPKRGFMVGDVRKMVDAYVDAPMTIQDLIDRAQKVVLIGMCDPLIVEGRGLTSIRGIQNVPSIQLTKKISLAKNRLSSIEGLENIFNNDGLIEVNLSGNQLTHLKPEFLNALDTIRHRRAQLLTIDLRNNKFSRDETSEIFKEAEKINAKVEKYNHRCDKKIEVQTGTAYWEEKPRNDTIILLKFQNQA